MPNPTLVLDGTTLVLKIRDKIYTLVAKTEFSTSGTPPNHILFKYKESYEDAIDVGTIEELLSDIQAMFPESDTLPPDFQFIKQWKDKIQLILQKIPISSSAFETYETIVNTNIRITEIEIDLTKGINNEIRGKFRFGFIFTPDPRKRPKLFNIEAVAFGTVVSVEISGKPSDLKINWP